MAQAIKSQPNSIDAADRAKQFKEKYISRLQYLKQHPWWASSQELFSNISASLLEKAILLNWFLPAQQKKAFWRV